VSESDEVPHGYFLPNHPSSKTLSNRERQDTSGPAASERCPNSPEAEEVEGFEELKGISKKCDEL